MLMCRSDWEEPAPRQAARTAIGTQGHAIDRSRGGLGWCCWLTWSRFILWRARHGSVGIEPLIENIDSEAVIADKAIDNNALLSGLNKGRALAVIPSKRDRKTPRRTESRQSPRPAAKESIPERCGGKPRLSPTFVVVDLR
jgi:hypothetical protein